MNFLQKYKTIIILLVVAVIGYFVYTQFLSATPATVSSADSSGVVGQDILDLVASFEAVSIDPTLFSNSQFQNLKDFTVVLQPESQGRVNPFAPLGNDISNKTSASPAAPTIGPVKK